MIFAMEIRHATADDLDAVHRIHGSAVRQGSGDAYAPEAIEAWASAFNRERWPEKVEEDEVFVVEDDAGQVRGFVSLNPHTSEVDSVYVDPAVAGQGIGGQMMDHILAVAREHQLESLWLDASQNAVPFYEKQGWVETDRCTRCRNGIDIECIRMGRPVG